MRILKQFGQRNSTVIEVERPMPGENELLIKTAVSAICGSEMHSYRNGGNPNGNMGHEAAGTVVETGAGVDRSMIGKRVGVSAIAGCGHCKECDEGRYTWCSNFVFHGNMHAEYFVVRSLACHVIPDDVSWDVGALISGDGLGVPYHTSKKIASSEIKNVVVFGLGPIGLGSILLQNYLGRRTIAIDRSPDRLKLAQKLGATDVICSSEMEDIPACIRTLLEADGADVCIEAAGVPATAKQCFAAARKGGHVIFNGEQSTIELSPSTDFIRRDITASGSWFYHFNEFPEMLALYRSGLCIESLITHRFPLSQIAEGYQLMDEGISGKIIINY